MTTTGVHFSGPTNSTLFTDCCDVAVLGDEKNCPKCGTAVPATERERWAIAWRTIPTQASPEEGKSDSQDD